MATRARESLEAPPLEAAIPSSPCPSKLEKVDEEEPELVTWDAEDDPANPQNWSKRYKWAMTIVGSIMTVNVTFASSAPTAAISQIAEHFKVSNEVANLVTSLFLLGYVFGPLLWAPGSEMYGRLPSFRIALIGYTLLHIGQALAPNIQTLLVVRFFTGFFAVAPLTNCGGLIADMWSTIDRGQASALFAACVFLGPVLGPIIGGLIIQSSLSWRWIFWVMMIFAGTCTAVMLVFLPETFAPVILLQKAKRLRKASPETTKHLYALHEREDWSMRGMLQRSLFRPFIMLAQEPILALLTVYLALVYGVLYALFEALPFIFVEKHHFNDVQVGLVFIGVGIGTSVGAGLNVWLISHYPRLIKTWKGFPPPEQRLFSAMLGGPLLVIGAFWLGWTGNFASIPWYVPALSTVCIGAGICLVFISFTSYMVDTYLMYSASAFAANTVIRSIVGAAFPLFTVQMYQNLGINWASTLIGLISLALAPIPFLFFKYGARIRTRSTFAPCMDLRIAKELAAEASVAAEREVA